MPSNLTVDVTIVGNINQSDLEASVQVHMDPNSGLMDGRLKIKKRPKDFAVIAASGQSWVCNTNSGGGGVLRNGRNLLQLSDFNYDLERRNEFPDGSAIDLKFKVRRVDASKVSVEGEWTGTYGLPVDIIGMKAPILEHLTPNNNGSIKGIYTYRYMTVLGSPMT